MEGAFQSLAGISRFGRIAQEKGEPNRMAKLRRHPSLTVAIAAIAAAGAVILGGLIGVTTHMRADIADTTGALSETAEGLPDLASPLTAAGLRTYIAEAPVALRLIGSRGQDLGRSAETPAIWDEAGAGGIAGLATTGLDVTRAGDSVEVVRPLADGRSAVVRAWLPASATAVSGGALIAILGAALIAAAIAAIVTWRILRRRRREVAAITSAAECLIAGRIPEIDPTIREGDLARAGDSIRVGAERIAHLTEIADREMALLTAAIEPLAIGVAGRGPAGSWLRNVTLERLVDGMGTSDRGMVEDALRAGLESTDPTGGQVHLSDGRVMDVDAWSVPGGRLVSVVERTEQERLNRFRRQIESSAVRQLKAPLDEIKTRGKQIYPHVTAPGAPTLRSLLAATDRLDRVMRMMLRGTNLDPAARSPRRERFGVSGFLWALAHDWDAALRKKAQRVELDIAPDLPDVKTDAALVEEILTELIDNSAKFTPRGGTIEMTARHSDGRLVLEVLDSGPGIDDADAPLATERFFRGTSSESIPGAGLGLGVASALADRIGASLEVISGPGGRVRLLIPVDEDQRALHAA